MIRESDILLSYDYALLMVALAYDIFFRVVPPLIKLSIKSVTSWSDKRLSFNHLHINAQVKLYPISV